ncbi:6667_t:CDS:2 [Gigaspora rosea]|nr:6667_t:CDS:2 [Gigaspora rosea]
MTTKENPIQAETQAPTHLVPELSSRLQEAINSTYTERNVGGRCRTFNIRFWDQLFKIEVVNNAFSKDAKKEEIKELAGVNYLQELTLQLMLSPNLNPTLHEQYPYCRERANRYGYQ